MKWILLNVTILLMRTFAFGEDLTPPAEPLAEQVEKAIKPAKDELLKAKTAAQEWYKKVLDSEMEKATKAGSLDDVQAIQKEKEEFAADESKWKSTTHKVAIKKYNAEIDAAWKKCSTSLDLIMKDQVRKKNIDVAAKIKEIKETGIDGIKATNAGGWINLLPLIDPPKDSVCGKWEIRNGELYSDNSTAARIEIPYRPPDEYDYRVVFTRTSGNESVDLTLSRSGKNFNLVIGGWGNTVSGISQISGKDALVNPTGVKLGLKNMQKYCITVELRKEGFRAILDNKEILSWKTDYSDVGTKPQVALRDSNLLGVYSFQSPTIFHSIEVKEVSGRGQKSR